MEPGASSPHSQEPPLVPILSHLNPVHATRSHSKSRRQCYAHFQVAYRLRCLNPFKAQWLLYVPPGLTFINFTFCPHSVFMCFVWISEQTAIISLYSINWLVFITETECVYCAVRTRYLYTISPVVTLSTARFNIHKFYVLPTQCVYVFCVDLRRNSDYFPIQH
jgi:hypothetical protein